MRRIIEVGLKFRLIVVALAVACTAFGVAEVRNLPVDVHPEFTPTVVEVQTEALGLSSEEVEQLITVPLEQDLLIGVPFLDEIESASLPGLSSVVMTFEPGTPLLDARQVVQERLTQAVGVAGLPQVAKLPQMIQPVSANRRVSMIKLSSESLDPIDVSMLARWVIGPRLMSVPGVANVTVWGFRDRQLQVLVDPEQLRENQTTLSQLVSTTGNALEVSPLSFLEASRPGTGGFIDTVNQRLNIFHEQTITTAEELAQVPLDPAGEGAPAAGGATKTLGDVATVVESSQPLIGDAVCPDGEKCLFLVVEKFPGANTLDVTTNVDAALKALAPGMGDLRFDASLYRPATFIQSSFETLGWVLLVGGLLVLLVLAALFWDWRRLLISAVAMVVSLAAAVVVLSLRGTTVNFMVAAGLVLGLTAVVHDAAVDPEALARRLRLVAAGADDVDGEPGTRARLAVVYGAADTRRALFCAALISATATIPLFFLPAEGDAFLPPLMLSYLLAIAASTVVAVLLTPALALMLLGRSATPTGMATETGTSDPQEPRPTWMRPLRSRYERHAPRLVGRTGVAVVTAGVIALVGVAALPFLDTSLRPLLKERDVLVHLQAPPGTSLPRMTELTRKAVDDLAALPGVVNVGGQVGRAIASDQIVNVNSGEVWVKVGPDADYGDTVGAIEDTVVGYQGLSTDVLTYSEERVTDILGRSSQDVVVRLYGEDSGLLNQKADEVQQLITRVDGVERANVERALDEPTVHVKVDLDRAQTAGVKPGDVRRAAATLLGGMTVGNLFEQQKVFDVVVWGTPEIRRSEADIEQLLVDTPSGGKVRIGDVADISIVQNPTVIRHDSAATYLDVTADVSGRDVADVAREIEFMLQGVQFPLEHHAELLGGYEERQADQATLIGVVVAVVIAIFLLLHAALRSWRLATLAFATLPLAMCGGLVAVLVTGRTLSLGSIAGLVAIVGVAARSVILLVRRHLDLRREGMAFGRDLVLRATAESLRTTMIPLLALAVLYWAVAAAGSAPGFEIVQPMAVVLLGGLVATAMVMMLVVPPLYLRFGSEPERDIWADDLIGPEPVQGQAQQPGFEPVAATGRTGVLHRWRTAFLAAPIALLLSACGGAIADSYTIEHEPATLQTVAGDRVRVTIEEEAARRLSLTTEPVSQRGDQLVVPSSAVFVDDEGTWWVYTSPERLAYERVKVVIDREEGGMAYLESGPPAGTQVLTVGVQQVHGVEDEVGH